MRNKGKELIEKYYRRMENDINSAMIRAEEGIIDYFIFDNIAETYRSRFAGSLDVILDLDFISMDTWSEYYDKSFKFYEEAGRRIRKLQFDPKDPED